MKRPSGPARKSVARAMSQASPSKPIDVLNERSRLAAQAYEELLARSEPAPRIERDEEDLFLSYTGGTTGLPKGVLFNIGQSFGNSLWFRDLFLGETTERSPVDFAVDLAERGTPISSIPASPLMHGTGFIFVSLPTLTAGGVVTTLEKQSFDPHELLVEATGEVRADRIGIWSAPTTRPDTGRAPRARRRRRPRPS